MKFSVLLPTRDRLDYLRFAIQSVLHQDYGNWEIIVSDNFSEEDIASYVRSIGDERIRYFRTDSFVPVTENWNYALSKSTGDQVIMLGDDDCLIPGYFRTMAQAIEEYDHPDLIYHGAYLYVYPGVMPDHPQGYLQPYGYAEFLDGAQSPFFLSHSRALRLVEQSMKFRASFGFNMQFALLSRGLVGELSKKAEFFQSPFPDYYAMNVAFLEAQRILAYPKPMVIIGVTPRSYGYFHVNRREREGMEFLGSVDDSRSDELLKNMLLPGTNINTSWLFAMELIRSNYGVSHDVAPDYRRYRFVQFSFMFENFLRGRLPWSDFADLLGRLSMWELPPFFAGTLAFLALRALRRVLSARWLEAAIAKLGQFRSWDPPGIEGRNRTALDIFESLK